MSLKRSALLLVTGGVALTIGIYVFVERVLSYNGVGPKLTSLECTDASTQSKVNPNKMLFISCGGFLD